MVAVRCSLLLVLLGWACTGAHPPDTRERGIWGTTQVIEEIRIGVAEGSEPLMFGRIGGLAVGLDGSIFAYDEQVPVIRMFDEEGTFLRDVGRSGQGPGEYSRVVGMKVLPSGELAVRDVANARITFYDAEGDHVDEIGVHSGNWGGLDLEYDLEDHLYVRGVRQPEATDGSTPRPSELDAMVILEQYTRRGERLEDIVLPSPDVRPEGRGYVLPSGHGYLRNFPIVTCFDWSPLGYLVVGRNDEYEIRASGRDGTVFTMSRDVPRAPILPEERGEWEAISNTVADRYRQQGVAGPVRPLPDRKPHFRGIEVGEEGRIWVHRYTKAEKRDVPRRPNAPTLTWLEPTTFDAFDPPGEFLGTVVVPLDTRILVWRGLRMWGIHTDEVGVQRIVRLRVEPGASR